MFPRLSINRLDSGLFLKEIFVFIFLDTSTSANAPPDPYKFCPPVLRAIKQEAPLEMEIRNGCVMKVDSKAPTPCALLAFKVTVPLFQSPRGLQVVIFEQLT